MSATEYTKVTEFRSSSNPKKIYFVKEKGGTFSCDCPAWRFKKVEKDRTCKHVVAAMKELGIDDNLSMLIYLQKRRKEMETQIGGS